MIKRERNEKGELRLKMIEYKEYIGIYEFDETKNMFFGKVTNCQDLIIFQGKSVVQVKEAFEEAVNEYLAWCKKYRRKTEKFPPLLKKEKNSNDTGGGGSN